MAVGKVSVPGRDSRFRDGQRGAGPLSVGRATLRAVCLGLVIACGPFAVDAVRACTVCFEMPKDSVADRIIDADLVAILREDPAMPFRYAVTDVLAGSAANVPPPPFLVDAVMRAQLAANPDDGALATWTMVDGWALHGLATSAMQGVARGVVAFAPDWAGPSGQQARFDYFADLHAAEDPAVQDLALIELARLPYAYMRDLKPGLDRQRVARRLVDPQYMEWAAVYILILGQSDDPADQMFVRRAAKAALAPGSRRSLAAWVTAWIEIDGLPAITAVQQALAADQSWSETDVRAAALGLAEHALAGDPAVAKAALAALRTVLELRPAASGIAARTFLAAQDWSSPDALAAQIDAGVITAPDDLFIVEAYLAAAQNQ